ncbi:4-hydroxybenzoyl-CoA reductase [Streptomyces fagopyri]|uniref:4-hydroxybenzoyl-CoA reductase n=1 Tax=Streptomyces fagopyri TaxID=2662397 RepID=A0A5Q0L8B0_9ACTN|nr:ABATE domain-containing protein [Streptomyces fagopyri]QFZ72829.1 4-hydroxybenzoyl-CoA reductase [Streptomyces fagopyri]
MPPASAPEPQTAFPFIGGRPALDFVATLGKRHTAPFERLPDPEALARWITEAGLHAGADGGPARISEADLLRARTLREAVHRLVRAAMLEEAPDPDDVARVNEAAALPDLAPQLAEPYDGPRPVLRWTAARPGPAALATVARDAVLLIGGPLLGRIKECESPTCSLLFLDDSQARRRRWCSMDRCGNLAKVAGYRSRGRTASTTEN